MKNKELVLETLKRSGRLAAENVQMRADNMTGTELNAETDYIPDFRAACGVMNMMNRKIGFVCKSSAGRVVKLLQSYDSSVFTQEPEDLPAQWGFVWSNDPRHALPFVAISTSPYRTGNVCEENGVVYRSKMDNNIHAPSQYPAGWETASE